MEGPWLASYVILWIVVIALALIALSHSRLIGVMYQRIGPAPARSLPDAFPVGAVVPEISATTLLAQPWSRTFPARSGLLGIFISPQCQTCNDLIPHIKDFMKEHRDIDVVLLSVMGNLPMNQAYARFTQLDDVPFVIADSFARDFPVPATPYGVRFDATGEVRAKGVVNNYEHLVSLCTQQGSSGSQE